MCEAFSHFMENSCCHLLLLEVQEKLKGMKDLRTLAMKSGDRILKSWVVIDPTNKRMPTANV